MSDYPKHIAGKKLDQLTLDDCVFLTLRKGRFMMFHEIQEVIKNTTRKFYGLPTISASIRNMRKDYARNQYELHPYKEVIEKRRRGKGYEYKLHIGGIDE